MPAYRFRVRCIAGSVVLCMLVAASVAKAASPSPPKHQPSQAAIDSEIDRRIATMIAIDNHAHPVLPSPGNRTDREFDALPVDHMEPETDPVAWGPGNPQLADAWLSLWGFRGRAPLDAAAQLQLDAARDRVRARESQRYADWLLAQSHVGVMLANRVAMGPGLRPPHFRWVPYLDCLLFPLDNSHLAQKTPDRAAFFPLEDKLRARYLSESGVRAMPSTLQEYLTDVVTRTLERQKAGGAIAVKFEVGYLRSFAFGDPDEAEAARVYASAISGPAPPSDVDYKLLQDYLFRYIARECGRLALPVQIHGMAGGGGYYDIAGSNPMLLEPLFDDKRLRQTNFVILHGGWPYVREAGALLQKPNVYLDISQQALLMPPRTVAGWLREWLEIYPGKVLFGTDAYPASEELGWEESLWLSNRNARRALGYALTGMVRDGEMDRDHAMTIARGVLSGNAATLYRIALP